MRSHAAYTLSFVAFALNMSSGHVSAQSPSVEKPASVAIVELFTSEGCSSCPPADMLLQQINLKQTSHKQLIVGISEHVTYWNELGWKDPYSLPAFTARQSAYASRLSPEGSYTPQMVVNGRDQFVGSDGSALKRALEEDSRRSHVALHIISSSHNTSVLDVTFSLSAPVSKSLDVIAVLTDDSDRSNVLRGENSGRSLQHVSVARFLSRIATVKDDAQHSIHIAVPDGFQIGRAAHHLILFAQEPHQGAIVGAETLPL
ncbi:DUF1223 domain-containing protein [Occallatibacter riparius]|uniref:DUF1223 domain-containing protein n=1 Tax=Occallatibacter riparius TaxID=1002689 RepID=A0A9J7BTU4_9BACT|nr:DUF1223 domain-containing protein [Occallatibacter riparius]UWZ84413.1 DUF1223 domain-containing protein [Occallatibacter riparius]